MYFASVEKLFLSIKVTITFGNTDFNVLCFLLNLHWILVNKLINICVDTVCIIYVFVWDTVCIIYVFVWVTVCITYVFVWGTVCNN